jgi:DNA-binding IclR family transcriptional regulator
LENARLSRSLLAGLLMLASFPSDRSYVGIAELARMLDMSPSTTHRYVTTLLAAGLLERDPRTRQYRLADAG